MSGHWDRSSNPTLELDKRQGLKWHSGNDFAPSQCAASLVRWAPVCVSSDSQRSIVQLELFARMPKISKRTSGDPTHSLQDKSAPDGRTDFLLVHVTAVGAAREIIRCGQIEMRKCSVFGKPLTYFFALRPAYRRKDGGKPWIDCNSRYRQNEAKIVWKSVA